MAAAIADEAKSWDIIHNVGVIGVSVGPEANLHVALSLYGL
jgi:hypothetical protein